MWREIIWSVASVAVAVVWFGFLFWGIKHYRGNR